MHIVITGASSGIGAAIARELARLPGAQLTLVARRLDKMQELAATLPVPCHIVTRDLSEPSGTEGWIEDAETTFGPVDVLVNNAGSQVLGSTASVDVAAGERSVFLNLLAPLRLSRAVLPSMIRRRRGHIVNIASMAAIAPTPWMTYYNASKAGLAAASEAMAGELRGTGVSVVTVYPGIIDETDMAQRALARYQPSKALSLQPTGSTAELAARIARRVRRPRHARVIYPKVNVLARWFPSTTRWIMDRFAPALRAQQAA